MINRTSPTQQGRTASGAALRPFGRANWSLPRDYIGSTDASLAGRGECTLARMGYDSLALMGGLVLLFSLR